MSASAILRDARSPAGSWRTGACQVLLEDPELADSIAGEERARAIGECVTREISLPRGRWTDRGELDVRRTSRLLVLEGVVICGVTVAGRRAAELVGQGDVLCRMPTDDAWPTLAVESGWVVLEPVRAAVLDGRFMARLARYPQIAAVLVERATRRSHGLAVNMAIVHQPRVEARVLLLLWHLAGRWGRVCSDGVLLPLRLTHSQLAELLAARRPTVSKALSDLTNRGLLKHGPRGWLLCGEPPATAAEQRLLHTAHAFEFAYPGPNR